MKPKYTKTPLTGEMMARGWWSLILFGTVATVLIVTPSLTRANFSVDALAGMALIVFPVAFLGWALGGLVLALPIWLSLHALGLRGWPVAVSGGAGLVGLIWFLATTDWTSGAAGAVAGAIAGWGMWWMAYRRGETGR